MKKSNKILAVLLALVMVITAVPMMTASAAEDKHEHVFEVVTGSVVKADCETKGETTYACECGISHTVVTDALGHTLVGSVKKNDEDTHKQFCDVCEKWVTAKHNWEDVKVTKEATCTEKGEKNVKCKDCGETATQEIAALGHTFTGLVIPNTTAEGANAGTHSGICTVCKATVTEPHAMDDGVVTKAPKCNKEGEKTYTCTVCKVTEKETLPNSHVLPEKAKSVDDATHEYTCTILTCGHDLTAEELKAAGKSNNHDFVVVVGEKSTCDGSVALTVTCKDCDYKLETKATEHKFGKVEKFDKDSHKQTCENCELVKTSAHNWKDVMVIKEATCTEAGLKAVACQDCLETATQEIPAAGEHAWTEWKVVKEPTKDEEGSKARECKNCGAKETEKIDKLEATDPVLGDVNNDGNVTAIDARMVLQHVAELVTLTEAEQKVADMNADGKVTAVDARMILQAVAGLDK